MLASGDTRLIDKNANGRPPLGSGNLGGNSLLDLHRFAIPAVLYSDWQLIGHPGGTRTLLLRVAKNAEPLEASRLDEINQSAEVFLRLTGKSDDKRGSNRQPRNASTEAADQVLDMFP